MNSEKKRGVNWKAIEKCSEKERYYWQKAEEAKTLGKVKYYLKLNQKWFDRKYEEMEKGK